MREYNTAYWDSAADSLARMRSDILGGEKDIHWKEALSELLPKKKTLRVLDAGCGSGFLSVILSKMGHQAVGIDSSPKMVQCAYETASAFGQRIEYRIMDINKMDFDDESFDAIVCCEVLSFLSDIKQAWIEFKRILKKEGRIIIFDTGAITSSQLQAQGFSHCRAKDFEGLAAHKKKKNLFCLTARKPSRDEKDKIPQIALFHRHIQTSKRQIQLYQNWHQSTGMPYPEYTVLNMISRHSKGVRPSDISSALVIPPQTLTRILAGLKRDGYIDRKTSDRDQRSAVITITDAGTEKIKPLQEALLKIEERAFFEFTVDGLAELCELSEKLFNSLDAVFK
ncbi:MAG: methyltransferase domain-containing protein [Treponema sp.]|jgi:ubiquinone/menaquinone biosynthesis C-methylase UbiE/DNA-binding MarR family transcriptional regulator|nr:methyltransferase domain-containing protein [Treponema sp.]